MNISIIIPVLNEEKRIATCLDSIFKQDFIGSFEILIVDNGCTDDTLNIIKNYPSVKIIQDRGHLGSARQTGLELATSPYIVFIDADEVANDNWLSELYKYSNNYDAVLGSVRCLPQSNNIINEYFSILSALSIIHFSKSAVVSFGTGNILINREKALSIGFDRSLPTAEDGDFSYRFLLNKNKIVYNPDAVIYHEMPKNIYGYIKYQGKLAFGLTLIIKKYKSIRLIKMYITSTFYFASPLFIIRVLRIPKQFKWYYLLLGFINIIIYISNLLNLTLPKSSKKVLRPK